MNILETTQSLGNTLVSFVQQFLPDLPAEVIRLAAAGLFGAMAFVLIIIALRLLRSKPRGIPHTGQAYIPRRLQQEGVVMDLLRGPDDDTVMVRCVITAARSGKIQCEIIERLDVIKARQGQEIVCVFAPMKTDDGRFNAFTAKLIQSDKDGRNTDSLILSVPTGYSMIPRRKHTRKKVADQQFIRVKVWIESPHKAEISFEDATPHIGINSFAANSSDQAANAVVNISNGGIGLSVRNKVIPETCGVGAEVVINLFMFNFKEKAFRPYWYYGQIRSMEEGRPGFTRIGIEFGGLGETDGKSGRLKWIDF